jgi:hypothetical protein
VISYRSFVHIKTKDTVAFHNSAVWQVAIKNNFILPLKSPKLLNERAMRKVRGMLTSPSLVVNEVKQIVDPTTLSCSTLPKMYSSSLGAELKGQKLKKVNSFKP